jgi:hypothetical protein
MKSFYAMRRANGDWFALDDGGHLRMPVFSSNRDAMIARSRDSTMECFRAAAFDACALEKLKITHGRTASFLIVSDPLRKLKHARQVGFTELALLIIDDARAYRVNDGERKAVVARAPGPLKLSL